MTRPLAGFLLGLLRFLVPVVIIAVGIIGARIMMAGRQDPPRAERDARATFVETIPVVAQTRRVTLSAYGTVQADRSVDLQAQVAGRVTEQSDQLQRGGIVKAGDMLVQIDRSDYELALQQEEAALAKAEFDLKLEQGRQVVAGREWKLLESTIEKNPLSEELALRKPHLAERQAAARAANSRVDKAKLDLERTTLRAPFNAVVLDENVEIGQLINTQSLVARLVCIDEFHVEVSIPLRDLSWVQIPGRGGSAGALVQLVHEVAEGQTVERTGEVVRLLGNVDPTGRMARVLVAVKDPLGVLTNTNLDSPLLVGEYLKVRIEGPDVEGLVAVPRRAVRERDQVWVKTTDDLLAIRQLDPIYATATEVMVQNNFEAGDEIVTTALEFAVPGMPLTTEIRIEKPATQSTESSETSL
ncbi:MAG: efflux RND transporter periplasmic adaptor subunit [Planctomycetota bacterium]